MKYVFHVIICITTLTLFAQNRSEYQNFIHITEYEGLASNSVLAIEKDDFGFMWIGTKSGLNRFDGEQFTAFEFKKNDTTSISDNHVLALENDPDGYIWIGTNRGLNRFNTKTNTLRRMNHTDIRGFEYRRVVSICRMRSGNVWIATTKGLYIFDKKKESFIYYDIKNFHGEGVLAIHQDSTDRIWLGSPLGLFTTIGSDIYTLRFKKLGNHDPGSAGMKINAIIEDATHNLWLGTENAGLVYYDVAKDIFDSKKNALLSKTDVRALQFDNDQNLWIGCFEGLIIMKKNGEIINQVYQTEKRYKISDGIKSLFVDDNGSVWIGGYYGGLKIYNKSFNTIKSRISLEVPDRKDIGLANTLAEDTVGNKYIGTKKNGVFVLTKDGSAHQQLTKILMKKLVGITIKSMLIKDHLLWITTLKNGVLIFDLATNQFRSDLISEDLHQLLNKSRVYSIDQHHNIIAFGTFGKGVILYDLKSKKIKQFPMNTVVGISNLGNVRVVFFDSKATLWIGTVSRLLKISNPDPEKNKPKLEEVLLSSKYDRNHFNVITVTEAENGNILVGTNESSFFIGKTDRSGTLNFENIKLPVKSVHGIVEHTDNTLWMSSNKGIIKYSMDTNSAQLFNENYGLINTEFRNHSFLKASNQSIYFGSSRGIIYFDPDELSYNNSENEIVLTDVTIQGKEPAKHPKNEITFAENTSKDLILLDYNESAFTIGFSDFNYSKILNHSYEYRLLGLHDYWKTTTTSSVSFNLQKPGDYIFEVKNKSFNPTQQNKVTSFPITLKAAPWKSWYAIAGYILIGVLGIIGVYLMLRSKTELRHQFELENLKNKKEKERFRSQIEFFTNLSHDFRTPLTLIIAPLNQVIEKYKGSKMVFSKLLTMQRNTDHMLHLINQVLDFHKIETEELHPSFEEHNIVNTIHNVYSSFTELAAIGNYQYEFITTSDQILLYYDHLMIERVLYNLISNAFKNTKTSGSISISVTELQDDIDIQIEDNGKGIDTTFVNKIFDRFFEIANDKNYKEHFATGTGIGLHITKKTIDLHHGAISVSSKKNEGSIFTIALRKGADHIKNVVTGTKKTEAVSYSEYRPITKVPTNTLPTELPLTEPTYQEAKPRILVVEDNEELRKFIADTLKTDCIVEQARNGREGYKKALQKKIHLIISDVIMPEMNGEELCKKIKNDDRTKHIPVILLTSRSSGLQKISGLESGADAYITKPFKTKEFLLIVRNQLATHTRVEEKHNPVIYASANRAHIDSEDEKLYKNTMNLVYQNINNSSFEIDMFCSELGISRYKLFSKIKEWTGQTPKEFIQTVRLKKASQLLEVGDLTISEICYEVGFNSPKYFATSFKKHYQLTPTEYAAKFGAG